MALKLSNLVQGSPSELQLSSKLFEQLQSDKEGFLKLAEFLRQKAGINLVANDKNLCLMASRLNPVLRERKIANYKKYLQILNSNDSQAVQEFICAMTTNTTEFFREKVHFDVLKQELPSILDALNTLKTKEIRVWCSATSTGQEVYTILMTLLEAVPQLKGWTIKMLATDIDPEVLATAKNGFYSAAAVKGISPLLLKKYFTDAIEGGTKGYKVKPDLSKLVTFKEFNLLHSPYVFNRKFDIVFCRNVLIYFEGVKSSEVVQKLLSCTAPHGCLFLGHSETGSTRNISSSVQTVSNAVYRPKQGVGK